MSNEESPQEGNITLFSLAKRLYQLYRPYFGLSGKKLKRSLWLGGIVLGNTLLAFSLAFVNISVAGLMGLIGAPVVTTATFLLAAVQLLGAILSYGILTGVDAWMSGLLGSSLAHAINKKLEKKWILGKAYYGMTLRKKDGINPSQILSQDNHKMNTKVMELFDNFLTTISNGVVGFVGLYTLSVPLSITLFSMSFTIPGYLLIGTIVYAIVYNKITNKMGDSLEGLQSLQREQEAEIVSKVHHVKAHAEDIAFKKGSDYEHESLIESIKRNKVIQRSTAKIQSLLNFATNLHAEFTSFFAILLCGPNIISKKLTYAAALEIPYHFQNDVNVVTWKSDNFDDLTDCSVSLERIEKFQGVLNKWEKLKKANDAKMVFSSGSSKTLEIKNLTLRKPDGTIILDNFSCTIPKGKVTLLQGSSGVGKTSMLRAIAGLSPYAEGEISGLSGNIHFIPSHPYFPMNRSLLDAIMYPRKEKATQQEIAKIKQLMNELGFKPSHIRDLEVVRDWSGPDLSDGEKQRIEIIGAIMKNPDFLFMDEATSRVDHDAITNNKGKIERLLKQHLPKATIVFTDHNPSEGPFCDNRIYLSNKMRRSLVRKI